MLRWGLAFIAVFWALSPVHSATVKGATLGELRDLAELIVVGKVTHSESVHDPVLKQVRTQIRIRIEETLKGFASEVLEFEQLGGTSPDGRFVQTVSGQASFAKGERVVVFMERADSGRLVVAGMAQGKFSLKEDVVTGLWWAKRDVSGLAFIGDQSKVRRLAFAPPDPHHLPLKTLRALIGPGLSDRTPQVITGPLQLPSATSTGAGQP